MDRLFTVVPKVLRKRGLQEHAEGALVVHRAQQWISEHLPLIAEVILVQSFKENTLFIDCEHSVALQECQAISADLHAYLRSNCPFTGPFQIRIGRK